MKRAISMLGAIAALAVGFFVAAPAAQAYTINCVDVPSSLTVYPHNGPTGKHPAQKCGTTPNQKASGMAGALYSMNISMPNAYSKLAAVNARFYIFNSAAEYDTFFDERQATPPDGTTAADSAHLEPSDPSAQKTLGITRFNDAGVPVWTVILVNSYSGINIDAYGAVGQTTAHEAGHWMDYFYRNAAGGNNTLLSATTMWYDLMNKNTATNKGDWTNLNNTTANPQCGIGGIFNGRTDFQTIPGTVYLCSGSLHNQMPLTGVYNGATNKIVLSLGFANNFSADKEVVANETAYWSGHSDDAPHGVMNYFDSGRFGCTKLLMGHLLQNGTLPTKTQMQNVALPGGAAGSAKCPTSGSGWTLPN